MIALFLDATTLLVVVAYAVSIFTWLSEPGRPDRQPDANAWSALLRPAASSTVAVALGFWPAIRSSLGGPPDHCLEVPGPHLCWLHAGMGGQPHDLAILAILTAFLAHLIWLMYQAGTFMGRLAQIEWVALPGAEADARQHIAEAGLFFSGPVTVLDTEAPICFVSGVRRPRLNLSTGLMSHLGPGDLAVVLAHEVAHVRRRDPLLRVIGHAAMLFHLPGLGRRAFDRWSASVERACDEAASEHVGSPEVVAHTLIRFQRLLAAHGAEPALPAVAGFENGGSEVETRVRALLNPGRAPHVFRGLAWPLILAAAAVWQVDALHAALEAILGTLHA